MNDSGYPTIKAEGPTVSFLSLAGLFQEDGDAAVLATAIEQHGICGWDRFDRFRSFAKDSHEASQALDLLAQEVQQRQARRVAHANSIIEQGLQHRAQDPQFDLQAFSDQAPELDHPPCAALLHWGWPVDRVPDLTAIQLELMRHGAPPPPARPQALMRSQNTDLRIIEALLAFCGGELTGVRHPHWNGDDQVIPASWTPAELAPLPTRDNAALRSILARYRPGAASETTLRNRFKGALEEGGQA